MRVRGGVYQEEVFFICQSIHHPIKQRVTRSKKKRGEFSFLSIFNALSIIYFNCHLRRGEIVKRKMRHNNKSNVLQR